MPRNLHWNTKEERGIDSANIPGNSTRIGTEAETSPNITLEKCKSVDIHKRSTVYVQKSYVLEDIKGVIWMNNTSTKSATTSNNFKKDVPKITVSRNVEWPLLNCASPRSDCLVSDLFNVLMR